MERRQKETSHCLFLFLAQLFFFHLYRSRLLQAKAWWHEPGFALDSYKRQLSSWELHALRCGNNTVRWPDKDLQMESEEVADAPALFSKWKSAPERRGHVLRSLFLSSPFFFFLLSLQGFASHMLFAKGRQCGWSLVLMWRQECLFLLGIIQ